MRCWTKDISAPQDELAVDLGTDSSSNPHTAQAITVGKGHVCAILTNGLLDHGPVKCWGANRFGELGLGIGASSQDTPDAEVDLGTVDGTDGGTKHTAKAIAMDGFINHVDDFAPHTCALLENGNMKCWGNNSVGQLGVSLSPNQRSGTSHGGNPAHGFGPMGNGLPYVNFGL